MLGALSPRDYCRAFRDFLEAWEPGCAEEALPSPPGPPLSRRFHEAGVGRSQAIGIKAGSHPDRLSSQGQDAG